MGHSHKTSMKSSRHSSSSSHKKSMKSSKELALKKKLALRKKLALKKWAQKKKTDKLLAKKLALKKAGKDKKENEKYDPLPSTPDKSLNYDWAERHDWTADGVTVKHASCTMDDFSDFNEIIKKHDVVLNSANTNLITEGVSGIAKFVSEKYPHAIEASKKSAPVAPGKAVAHTLESKRGYKKLIVHAVCMRKKKARKGAIQVHNPDKIGEYVVQSVRRATKKAFQEGHRTIVGKTMGSRWTYSNVLSKEADSLENQKIRNYIFLEKMISGFKRAKRELKKEGANEADVEDLHLTIFQARKI